jgi:nucleoside-diphosphate-sugar epimerase
MQKSSQNDANKIKKILWTGSHGFIAGYAINKLLEEGHEVWGIDNFSKYGPLTKDYDNHPRFHFIEGDAKDAELLRRLLIENNIQIFVAGAAIIGGITMFHSLAYDLLAENEKITCAAFDACLDAYKIENSVFEKIVAISSSMVFESVANEYPTPEDAIDRHPPPFSTYGFQKLAVEYFAKGASIQYGLPYTVIRPFNAIGIGEKRALVEREIYSGNVKLAMSHVLPDIIQKIAKGQYPLRILGSGSQIRHYTYGGDLANGIYECIINPNALNDTFNLSTATGHSVIDLAKEVWKAMGKNPTEFQVESDPPYEWDVQKRIPEVSKAREKLGVECKTPLSKALDEIIPWVTERIKLGEL